MNDYVEATLRRMGHDVVTFEHYRYRIPGRLRARVPLMQSWEIRRINRALVEAVRVSRPDLLLVLGGVTIRPEALALIRRQSVMTANWFSDYPAHFEYTMEMASAYDYLFVSDTMSRDRHRAAVHRNVHWLPLGCLPEWAALSNRSFSNDAAQVSHTSTNRRPDVVFVGSWYAEREQLLSALRGCHFAIWGPGWLKHLRDHTLRERISGESLRTEAWRSLYRTTPISLNLHYGFGMVQGQYGAMANTRVFEILASGGFMLCDEKKDLAALLTAGRDYVGFRDAKECAELINYYLSHPKERQTIAEHGQRTVLNNHTYCHRLTTLLDIIEGSA